MQAPSICPAKRIETNKLTDLVMEKKINKQDIIANLDLKNTMSFSCCVLN